MLYISMVDGISILSVAGGCPTNKEKRSAAKPIMCVLSMKFLYIKLNFWSVCRPILVAIDDCKLIPVFFKSCSSIVIIVNSLFLYLNHQIFSYSKLHQEEGLLSSQVFNTVSIKSLAKKFVNFLSIEFFCINHSERILILTGL